MSEPHPVGVTLENRLMGAGIYVTAFERDGNDITLKYELVTDRPGITRHEVSTVVRTVLDIADERESFSPGTLQITSTGRDGSVRGHYHVKEQWFEDLYDDLDELEFSKLVIDSITPPEP